MDKERKMAIIARIIYAPGFAVFGALVWLSMIHEEWRSAFVLLLFLFFLYVLPVAIGEYFFYRLRQTKTYYEKEFEQLVKNQRKWEKASQLSKMKTREINVLMSRLSALTKESERKEISMLKAFADLKAEREKAALERDKAAAIVNNFVDPIVVLDSQDKIALFNPAAKSILNLNEKHIGQVVAKKDNYSMQNFKKILGLKYDIAKKANEDGEVVTIKHAGQDVTYKVITARVEGDRQENLGVMKLFYNLTREKMVDKLKSEFISIAAHQLRTPLSAIKWAIGAVMNGDEGRVSNGQKKMLSMGYLSNERMIRLVNDLLDVSRIEEGRFGYIFAKGDFNMLLNLNLGEIKNQLEEKNIKLALTRAKKLPDVYMDKERMYMVLQNLIENAVKYTPVGGTIKIDVSSAKNFLRFKIKDNGVGIPNEEQPKLFSKFFRAANVMRMQTEGSGLGLFIAKNIIKRHGGEISFKSEEGMGTEFTFTIPINK